MGLRRVLRGTSVLVVAAVFSRILGFGYRIALARLLGAEGVGLYQMVTPIYTLLMALVSFGLTPALAHQVAALLARHDRRGAETIHKTAVGIVLTLAIVIGYAVYRLSPIIASGFLHDQRTTLSLQLLPAALLFYGLAAVHRGFFHGQQKMTPSASAQMLEQVVRVVAALILIPIAVEMGLRYGVMAAIAALICGELTGWAWLRWSLHKQYQSVRPAGSPRSSSTRHLIHNLLTLSAPLAATRLIASVGRVIHASLIPARLQVAGYSSTQATAAFGELMGMAFPLFYAPMVLIYPLSQALNPAIAEAYQKGETPTLNRLLAVGFTTALLCGFASTIILRSYPGPLAALLDHPEAAPLVAHLGWMAPLAFLEVISSAILNGFGVPIYTFWQNILGIATQTGLIYILAAHPEQGVHGAITAFGAGYAVSACYGILTVIQLTVQRSNRDV